MRQDKIHIPAAIPFSSELLALEKVQMLKVLEEAAETTEAWKDWQKGKAEKRQFVDETADLIQALVNLLAVSDVSDKDLVKAMQRCDSRNGAKGRLAKGWKDEKEQFEMLDSHDKKVKCQCHS